MFTPAKRYIWHTEKKHRKDAEIDKRIDRQIIKDVCVSGVFNGILCFLTSMQYKLTYTLLIKI